jgi:hypothetical protein
LPVLYGSRFDCLTPQYSCAFSTVVNFTMPIQTCIIFPTKGCACKFSRYVYIYTYWVKKNTLDELISGHQLHDHGVGFVRGFDFHWRHQFLLLYPRFLVIWEEFANHLCTVCHLNCTRNTSTWNVVLSFFSQKTLASAVF